MAYFAPYIDETGYHYPSYTDIRDDLLSQARRIFGNDIYLDEDSQDYELISIFAERIFDSYQTLVNIYNSFSVSEVLGRSQDRLYALNGIIRKKAEYSTCTLRLTGDPGSVINNGRASDGTHQWQLPAEVRIPAEGSIEAKATCLTIGAIDAPINTITTIVTPTMGWTEVTNPEKAFPGIDVESHEAFRSRQRVSTERPSRTVLQGTEGEILSLQGVRRARVYENDTNIISPRGEPPHSITAVVEGGDEQEIAKSIQLRKTPGCYTDGDIEVEVVSPNIEPAIIRFYRPIITDVQCRVSVKPLFGFTQAMLEQIVVDVNNYINSLSIGAEVTISAIWGIALAANADLRDPNYSITQVDIAPTGDELAAEDIAITYRSVAASDIENIEVVVT